VKNDTGSRSRSELSMLPQAELGDAAFEKILVAE
jgi:hypothetical protein